MIKEYAIDPELAATWGQKDRSAFILEALVENPGRLIGEVPHGWLGLVDSLPTTDVQERIRRVELLKLLKQRRRVRCRNEVTWNEGSTWLANALQEHQRAPFAALICNTAGDRSPEVLDGSDLYSLSNEDRWKVRLARLVPKTSGGFAGVLESVLAISREVCFVDPYFSPGRAAYVEVFSSLLPMIGTRARSHAAPNVRIYCDSSKAARARKEDIENFKRACSKGEKGPSVSFWELRAKPKVPPLHDRYLITEIAGVALTNGFDADNGIPPSKVHLSLMSQEDLEDTRRMLDPRASPRFNIGPLNV